MTMPVKNPIRAFVIDALAVTAGEIAVAGLARRLTKGPAKPHRRLFSRAVGAVLSELVAEGATEVYWQRLRMRAAVNRGVAAAQVKAPRLPVTIPAQRAPERSAAEHLR